MAHGGGQGRHVAERGGVVQHGGPAEGDGGGGGGAADAVDRRDVQLVRAVAVGGLLGCDLDLFFGRGVCSERAVDSYSDAWQEVAVVGEGAAGARVTEHRARHRQICAAAMRALAFRTWKKKKKNRNQQHLQHKKRQIGRAHV